MDHAKGVADHTLWTTLRGWQPAHTEGTTLRGGADLHTREDHAKGELPHTHTRPVR